MQNSRSGSSSISEGKRNNVNTRDAAACVVCGIGQVDVAHIVARAGDSGQVRVIPSLPHTFTSMYHLGGLD